MKNAEGQMSLEEFINRPYPVVVREVKGKICLFVPKLQLFVESDTLQSAFELCQAEKKSYYNRLLAIDSLHVIPTLTESVNIWKRLDLQKTLSERLISFFFTTVFWVVIILVAGHQVNKALGKMELAFVPVEEGRSEIRLERFKEKLKVAAPYIKEVKKTFNE